jgi:uncharacterized membrane protein (DUF4010 family)
MAALFQGVLFGVYAARQMWGASGIFASAALLGLTDVDALTVSMTRDVAQHLSVTIGAAAIAIGVLSNTTMKLGMALVLGSGRFRMIASSALAAMLAAGAIVLAVQLR